MALVACAVRVALGSPVFFVQERAGRGGRPFRLFKFRSMRTGPGTDAERLTPFGRFLRASSSRSATMSEERRSPYATMTSEVLGVRS